MPESPRPWPVVALRAAVAVAVVLLAAALAPVITWLEAPDALLLVAMVATVAAAWLVVRRTRPPAGTVSEPDVVGAGLGVAIGVLAFVTEAAATDLVATRLGLDAGRTFAEPAWSAASAVLLAGAIVLRELRRELAAREGPLPRPVEAQPRRRPREEDETPWPAPAPEDAAADVVAADAAAFAVADLYPGRTRRQVVLWAFVAVFVPIAFVDLTTIVVLAALFVTAVVLVAGTRGADPRPGARRYRPRSWRWLLESASPVAAEPPARRDGMTPLVDPELTDRDALRTCEVLRRAGPLPQRYLRDALGQSARGQALLLVRLVESGHVLVARTDKPSRRRRAGDVYLTAAGRDATARPRAALAVAAGPARVVEP